ncbi:hypothetical protein SGRIM119S_03463 [Streptomyces griseorubiginosus]
MRTGAGLGLHGMDVINYGHRGTVDAEYRRTNGRVPSSCSTHYAVGAQPSFAPPTAEGGVYACGPRSIRCPWWP